jgi:peptide/nickel transport system substrate-binding protein
MFNLKTTLVALIAALLLGAGQQNLPLASAPAAEITPSLSVDPASPAPTPAQPTRLNLTVGAEPATLDPHRTSEMEASEIFGRICEPLIYQSLDLTAYPLLAEALPKTAPDGLAVTVALRQGITFQDGTPLNSQAVKFTFERLQQPESQDSAIYDNLQGVAIETPDDRTVSFRFAEPRYDFIDTLGNSYAVIISPTAVKTAGDNFGRQPVCTGPYQLKEWVTAQYVLLTKNPAYHRPPAYYENKGPAKIDEIKLSFVEDSQTGFQALLNGETDILGLNTVEEVAEIKGLPDKFSLYESWSGGISYLGFNYNRPPLNEPLVRQALAQAINKQVMVDTTLPGLAAPAFAPLAPSVFGYSPDLAGFEYKFDPKQSQQLLEKAGFSDSDGDGIRDRNGQPLRLEVLTTPDDIYHKVFVLLQSQLREVGVDITIRPAPPAEIAEITPTGQFDLLLYHYNWPYPNALQLFLGTERIGASNRVGYSNPEVDNLLAQAGQQPDNSPEKRELLIKAQQIILQDAPWQPLFTQKSIQAVNNRVQGVRTLPAGDMVLHDAYIQP